MKTLQELILPTNGKWKKTRSKEIKQWVEELRKPHRKARGQLKKNGGYCCLGVYCNKVAKAEVEESCFQVDTEDVGTFVPILEQRALDYRSIEFALMSANDGEGDFSCKKTGFTHKEIADWIEINLIEK